MTDNEIAVNWVQYYQKCIAYGIGSPIAEESYYGFEAFDEICLKEPIVAHLTTIVSPAKIKSYDGVKMLAGLPH